MKNYLTKQMSLFYQIFVNLKKVFQTSQPHYSQGFIFQYVFHFLNKNFGPILLKDTFIHILAPVLIQNNDCYQFKIVHMCDLHLKFVAVTEVKN